MQHAQNQPPRGQSGLGIASFVISILMGLGLFGTIFWAGYVETTTPGGMDENSPVAAMIGLAVIGGLAVAMLGVVLGIIACVQKSKGKMLGIIGLILNTLLILGVCGLMIVYGMR